MVNGTRNENLHILGRTSEQTSMVSRDSQDIAPRSNLRLFEPQFNGQTSRPTWFASMKLDHFQDITCSQCVNYLAYIFDASDRTISVGGLPTTPAQFLISLPSVATLPAAAVGPIKFAGGPPSKLGTYRGSLLTFLVDLVLLAVANNDKKILKRLHSATLYND